MNSPTPTKLRSASTIQRLLPSPYNPPILYIWRAPLPKQRHLHGSAAVICMGACPAILCGGAPHTRCVVFSLSRTSDCFFPIQMTRNPTPRPHRPRANDSSPAHTNHCHPPTQMAGAHHGQQSPFPHIHASDQPGAPPPSATPLAPLTMLLQVGLEILPPTRRRGHPNQPLLSSRYPAVMQIEYDTVSKAIERTEPLFPPFLCRHNTDFCTIFKTLQ